MAECQMNMNNTNSPFHPNTFIRGFAFIACLSATEITSAQNGMQDLRDTLMVNIISNVKAATAGNVDEKNTTGTGQLGVSWQQRMMYGSILFNVINRNDQLAATDTGEVVLFANNLLIPDNSGQGFGNFRIDLGIRSFASEYQDWDLVHPISEKRLGVYGFWQMNNTQWTKDSISTPLFVSSFGLYVTYGLLSAQVLNKDKDDIAVSLCLGWEARRLGGDYALKKNADTRMHFLGTTNYGFNAVTVGARLDLGKFYGKIQFYDFGQKDQIDGFSGPQALITVGLNVELNVAARNVAPSQQRLDKLKEKGLERIDYQEQWSDLNKELRDARNKLKETRRTNKQERKEKKKQEEQKAGE